MNNLNGNGKTDHMECPICLDNIPTLLCNPCGHGICHDCKKIDKCPICRQKIESFTVNRPLMDLLDYDNSKILERDVKVCVFNLGSIAKGICAPYSSQIVPKDQLVSVFDSFKLCSLWISDQDKVTYVDIFDNTHKHQSKSLQLANQFASSNFLNILIRDVQSELMSFGGQCWLEILKILHPKLHEIQTNGDQRPITLTYYDRSIQNTTKFTRMTRIIKSTSTGFIVTMEIPGIYGSGSGPTLPYHFYYLFHDGRVLPCSYAISKFTGRNIFRYARR